MKLRNKKTGEIRNAVDIDMYTDSVYLKVSDGEFDNETIEYRSLAELNEEWEDYEEPKDYWIIDEHGKVHKIFVNSKYIDEEKEIGNYFETREEAEKAVEKLKAIKILMDNGFRFIQWEFDMKTIADGKIWFDVGVNTQWDAEQLLKHRPQVKESLDLLFGGEE